MQVDRRILFLEAAERGEHLVLVALRLGLDRKRHDWRRQLVGRHPDWFIARGQPVSRARVLELRNGTDVAGADLLGVPVGLAREHDQLADTLARMGTRIQQLRVVVQHALIDAEEVDPPGVGIGACLEDVGKELAGFVGRQRHLGQLESTVLDRRR